MVFPKCLSQMKFTNIIHSLLYTHISKQNYKSLSYKPNVLYMQLCKFNKNSCLTVRNLSDKSGNENLIDNDPEIKKLVKEMHRDFGMSPDETLKELEESNKSKRNFQSQYFKDHKLEELITDMYQNTNKPKDDNINSVEKDGDFYLLDSITQESEVLSEEFNPNIIYDFDEEQTLKKKGLWKVIQQKKKEKPAVVNYKRGITGAFDVEELVELLRDQKATDVVAIEIPAEHNFVDHMVIATCKSLRQVNLTAAYIKKINKLKKNETDPFIVEEGKGSNWIAFDFKNIALHLMTEDVREEKDLEMLWTVGVQYDPQSQEWLQPKNDELLFYSESDTLNEKQFISEDIE